MNRKTIIILSLILFLLVIAGTGLYYIKNKLPEQITRMIEKEMHTQLNQGDAEVYDLEVAQVQLSFSFPHILIPKISIQPTEKALRNIPADSLPCLLIQLTIHDLGIDAKGILPSIRNSHEIVTARTELYIDNLTLYINARGKKEKVQEDTIAVKGKYGSKGLDLQIRTISYRSFPDTSIVLGTADNIHFTGGITASVTHGNAETTWQITNYHFSAESTGYFPAGELYSYHTSQIRASDKERLLKISSAALRPIYNKKEFQQHIDFQTDRMDVMIEEVVLRDFDLHKLLHENTLTLSAITVNHAAVGVFRDRHLPLDTLRRPHMPVKRMRNAPLLFFVPEIELNSIDVIYTELAENSNTAGIVPITNIQGKVTNFTNIADSLQADSIMHISAAGQFFEEGQLSAAFDYNLQDLNGGYRARGELSELNFTRLNKVLFPLLNVEVDKGIHSHTRFTFSGNDQRSTGQISMLYEGLNIVLEPERSRIRRSITGWAGRNLLYYSSNPDKNDKIREGVIDFERDPTRFVFHYWWNCYLTGIKSTVLRGNFDL